MLGIRLSKGVIDAAVPALPRAVRASRHGGARPDAVTVPDLYIWDGGKGAVSGFGLKVTPTGSKVFVFQYRLRGAKSDRRYKIGRYGEWTVDLARDRARQLRTMVDSGVDPLEHDKEQAKAREVAKRAAIDRAFSTVSGNWLKAYESERRARGGRAGRLRSASTLQMAKTAMGHFQLQFAGKRVDEIDDVELSTALGKIPAAKLATRRNAFAVARIFWRWAVRQRLVDESPCDRLDAPPAPVSRSRVLSDVELGIIWRASRKMTYPFGPAFRLLILTGQRREEITAMAWGELDREARQWCIAADRTKNGLPHIVPLSAAVIAELDGLALKDEWPTKGLVFTTTGETAVSGHSGAKRQLDALADKQVEAEEADALGAWRVHDLRRTVATGLQRLGVRLEVTEAVLNHVSGSRGGIVGVYQRHNWAEEKREALGLWADAVLSLSRPKAAAGARRDAKKSSPGKAR